MGASVLGIEGPIGVICGLKSEAACLEGAGASVRLGVSGASAARAEAEAEAMAEAGVRGLLSFGVSGALAPDLRSGDLLIADEVVVRDGEAWRADEAWRAGLRTMAPNARMAKLLGSDELISTVGAKAALYAASGAVAVDMETHAVARAAAKHGLPFAALRAVADEAGGAIPQAASHGVAPDGGTRALAVVGAMMLRPQDIPGVLRLGRESALALKALRGVAVGAAQSKSHVV